jgi:DNA ligase 1
MKDFAELYRKLDETTSTNRKIDAMVDYFQLAPERDAIWTDSFLLRMRF